MANDLHIDMEYARIEEIRGVGGKELTWQNENCLRVYCYTHPDTFALQIRTYKPIRDTKNAKPRNMIATVHVSIEEMRRILAYMENKAKEA